MSAIVKLIRRKPIIVIPAKYEIDVLKAKTVPELKKICSQEGYKGYSNKKKEDLMEFIIESQKAIMNANATATTTKPAKTRKSKVSTEDNYSDTILKERYTDFHNTYVKTKELGDKCNLQIRLPIMPEDISENIVKFIMKIKQNKNIKWSKAVGKQGDLYSEDDNAHIEVKTFMSDGPISFGPKEAWSVIYFLDARQFMENKFTLYYLPFANDSELWKKLKVNKTDTFEKQANEKRRPRNNWENIKLQVEDKLEKIFEGSFEDIFTS